MGKFQVLCRSCGASLPEQTYSRACPACGGEIAFVYDLAAARLDAPLPGIWRYIDFLPVADGTDLISLGEGGTPMVPSMMAADLGCDLRWKVEGTNPTGAQKDRGLAVAMTQGRAFGFTSAIIGSTGSAGLSSAAYAARGGLRHAVLVSRDTPPERVLPMAVLGSTIFEVDGNIEDTLGLLARACEELGAYETTTYRSANPYQSEGAKTLGYEIIEQFGGVPDWIVLPIGGGGTLGSVWRGMQDLRAAGVIDRMPRLAGVQPADYNGLVIAEEQGLTTAGEILEIPFGDVPPTILVKLAHLYPHDGLEALEAIRASGGAITVATDAESLDAQRRIGARDGIYAEPSSTVTLIAIEQLRASNTLKPGESVVGVLTGSGHRETHVLAARGELEMVRISPVDGIDRLAEFLVTA